MKWISCLFLVLIILPSVLAVKTDVEYKTWVNITMLPSYQNATNQCGNVTIFTKDNEYYFEGNSSVNDKHEITIKQEVDCEEINPQLSNFTYAIGEMAESYKGFMDWCAEQKKLYEEYKNSYGDGSAKAAEVAMCNENLRKCNEKEPQLTSCQSELSSKTSLVTTKDSELTTCSNEKNDMKNDWLFGGVVGILLGGGGYWLMINKKRIHKDVPGPRENELKDMLRNRI